MSESKKLTEEKTWSDVWESHSLPQVFKTDYNPYYVEVMDKFFHKYLPEDNNFEFLELGCAPGRWMHYFHDEFGYKVSGIDYSKIGVEATRENMRLLNTPANVFEGDVLNFQSGKKYDMVFSIGLIEHFDPPKEIIQKHFDLLNERGYLIIGVPNLSSPFYRFLQFLINKELLKEHVIITKKDFEKIKTAGFETIYCNYFGVFNLFLLGIAKHKIRLHKTVNFFQTVVDKFLRKLNIQRESKIFSPYIFLILKKI